MLHGNQRTQPAQGHGLGNHSGPVNAEVILTLDGGRQVTAIITNQSMNAVGLADG
jgi:hypothetical protein